MARCFALIMALLGLSLWSVNAGAEEELAPGFDRCMENAPSTVDQKDCVNKAYAYWDKILNINFKKAKKSCADSENPKTCASSLVNAQKSWIKYKEEMPTVIYMLNGGGTLSQLEGDIFVVKETKKQAQLLSVE